MKNNIQGPTLFERVFGGGTPLKALLTAIVVGTILTIINHGDVIIHGEFPNMLKVMLTYCVPFFVTTWGAVLGKKYQWEKDCAQNFSNLEN
jgi:hypothetical protein